MALKILLIGSESVCSLLNESLATKNEDYCSLAQWLTTVPARDLKNFANEPILVKGMTQMPAFSDGW